MKAKDVLRLTQFSRITLMNHVKNGKIKANKLPNGYYDYDEDDVMKFVKNEHRKNVIYARVSTYKQKNDLDHQIHFLNKFCKNNDINIDQIVSDISSGLDLDRPNFSNLLDDILHYRISTVVISFKDRLTRLSFPILQSIFNKFGTNIIIASKTDDDDDNTEEYFEDLMALMHIFSTKVYSNRRKLLDDKL